MVTHYQHIFVIVTDHDAFSTHVLIGYIGLQGFLCFSIVKLDSSIFGYYD